MNFSLPMESIPSDPDSSCDGERESIIRHNNDLTQSQAESSSGSSSDIIHQIGETLESPLDRYHRPVAEMERFFKPNTPWGTDQSKFNAIVCYRPAGACDLLEVPSDP